MVATESTPFLAAGFNVRCCFLHTGSSGVSMRRIKKQVFTVPPGETGAKGQILLLEHLRDYIWIQLQLWINIIRRLLHELIKIYA